VQRTADQDRVLLRLENVFIWLALEDEEVELVRRDGRAGHDAVVAQVAVLEANRLTVLNGDGVYAELMDNGQSILSNLNAANVHWPGKQDFNFGLRGDHTSRGHIGCQS
jgi:hypothetical protein